ncbi:unnamed protein product [Caenorhabditis nigoni]
MDSSKTTFEYETAYELLVRLGADGLFLYTSLPTLNQVLELVPGKCYELDGDIGSGKTQICYSLTAKLLLTKKTAKIGWISAVPLRTDHLSQHFSSTDSEETSHLLDRIVCKRVETVSELRDSLNALCETINMQLVIVDNIDALLHDTAYDREMGRNVQIDISERLRRLTRSGITVMVTNHITHWRGYPAPALGNFWASQIENRFFVERRSEESNIRSVSTMKGGNEQTIRVDFEISDGGLKAVV